MMRASVAIIATSILAGCASTPTESKKLPFNVYDDNRVAVRYYDAQGEEHYSWVTKKDVILAFNTGNGYVNAKDVKSIVKKNNGIFIINLVDGTKFGSPNLKSYICSTNRYCSEPSASFNDQIYGFSNSLMNGSGKWRNWVSPYDTGFYALPDPWNGEVAILDEAGHADVLKKAEALKPQWLIDKKKWEDENAAYKEKEEKIKRRMTEAKKGDKDFCTVQTLETHPTDKKGRSNCHYLGGVYHFELIKTGWMITNIMPRPVYQFGPHIVYDYTIEKTR